MYKLTHSAGRVSVIYHIVIFERSRMTVRNTQVHCRVDAPFAVASLSLIDVDMPNWLSLSANQFLRGRDV